MPDQFSPEFKNENFEAEVRQIQEEVEKQKKAAETLNLGGRELLKKALQASTPPPAAPNKVQDDQSAGALPNYAESAPPSAKLEVEHLISKALSEGVMKAVKEASQSSPFVLDTFHDALAGKLYDEFKRRGLLK
ncbi:MAG: hypothetical protein HY093_04755 [Candidatus Liptonbacteria bacterium]|nr:hypothetical protein [Candidatus Liptonbacteria bacterium]